MNNGLGLKNPEFIEKPFSSLESMFNNIVNIDNEDYSLKERLGITLNQISHSINIFEKGKSANLGNNPEINLLVERVNEIQEEDIDIVQKIFRVDKEIEKGYNRYLSQVYLEWAWHVVTILIPLENSNEKEKLFRVAIKNFHKSTTYDSQNLNAFMRWGILLTFFAFDKSEEKASQLYTEACEKYEQATKIDANLCEAFFNWGEVLRTLAQISTGEKTIELLRVCC